MCIRVFFSLPGKPTPPRELAQPRTLTPRPTFDLQPLSRLPLLRADHLLLFFGLVRMLRVEDAMPGRDQG